MRAELMLQKNDLEKKVLVLVLKEFLGIEKLYPLNA